MSPSGPRTSEGLLASLVAKASEAAGEDGRVRDRAAALAAIVPVLATSARGAGVRAVAAGRWLTDVVTELVPHLTVRDAATLRRHFPGLTDDEIADRLVTHSVRATAAVGAAAGGLAAAEFAAPPTLLAAPIQLAAETVVTVAIEIKLVAELHEIYGLSAPGGLRESGSAYLSAWVRRRAVTAGKTAGLGGLVGDTAARELRTRLLRRVGRSTTSLAPFLAGAAAGAEVNRRSTRDLGTKLVAELRGMTRGRPHADITVTRPAPVRPVELSGPE